MTGDVRGSGAAETNWASVPLERRQAPDVSVDANGDVRMNNKGMSVFRSLADLGRLPARLVPMRLAHRVRGATGPTGTYIWSMGVGPFAPGAVTPTLRLHATGGHHGTVCPAHIMSLAALQSDLAATQSSWDIDEPP